MTIYVDTLPTHPSWGRWAGGAHMMTTDIDELHAFAKCLGLRREWFQDGSVPHYDLTPRKRALAIKLGATEVGADEGIPDDVLLRCADGTYETRHFRLARRAPPSWRRAGT